MSTTGVPEPPPEVVLRPDGQIEMELAGQRYRLRRPKLGEYRRFREMFFEIQDMVQEHAQHLTDMDRETREDRDLLTKTRRQLNDDVERMFLEWNLEAIRVLADKPLPDPLPEEDLPVWAMESDAANAIAAHWREVPFGSGGS